MTRRLSLLVALAGVLVAISAGVLVAQSTNEHARLLTMAGTWNVEMTLHPRPGGPAIEVNATSTIRPLFDMFIEERIEGALNGTAFTTLAWTGYNPSTGHYEATRISSTNPSRIVETGTYNEKDKQYELTGDYVLSGETWHQRTVIETKGTDEMTATSYLRFGSVPEWKSVEIKYKRAGK